ncbi:hypothetical protein DPQ33_13440 [Oceanidesulfovibrio indonesiensis]|jgi:hypothetical protein|uniref:Uncharacterized protein n=2 Tax=Oceanidesulfovibrio indonesiensis TaxID=54767 RepID=A0A7M3MCC6_9BACT|nr:hypothetical protein DPQ33_13440 [Oceanidesulfovibrio indonesiensis]
MREERINPGLNQEFRCSVLKRWENAFDALIDRVDAFGLDDEQASHIWERRLETMIRRGTQCRNFELIAGDAESDEAPAIACTHVHGDLCMLALPRCSGVCAYYISRRETVDRAIPAGDNEPEEE